MGHYIVNLNIENNYVSEPHFAYLHNTNKMGNRKIDYAKGMSTLQYLPNSASR